MAESPDYKELLHAFNEQGVRYLIVGGYAVMKYTEPRYTKDLDVWVGNSVGNAKRVFAALVRFGAPLGRDQITPATFCHPNIVYQIGVPPIRIDICTHIDGVAFAAAWRRRAKGKMFGIEVDFISRNDLTKNKQAVGRRADQDDLERLKPASR
jgi:hypothetical protein